jgi:hypothetical protein
VQFSSAGGGVHGGCGGGGRPSRVLRRGLQHNEMRYFLFFSFGAGNEMVNCWGRLGRCRWTGA